MSDFLAAARAWYDAGYCVVPAHSDGSKRPWGSWEKYQVERLPFDELAALLDTGKFDAIGVICGHVSGNVEMIELEARAAQRGSMGFLRDLAQRNGIAELLDRLVTGCSELTPTFGTHYYARCSDRPIAGNLKLAREPGENNTVNVLAETRGEGGFSITWPSPGRSGHPEGRTYLLAPGSHPSNTPTFTGEEIDQLHWLFSQLDDMPAAPAAPATQPISLPTGTLTSWDDYQTRTTWAELLTPHGWTFMHHGQRNGHTNDTWCRPGKNPSDGPSATTAGEDGPMYVFSSSTTLPTEEGLSKFYVYAHYEHNGDMQAAARALYAAGYGERLTADLLPAWDGPNPLASHDILTAATDPEQDSDDITTWADLSWITTGERRDPPPPTHLTTVNGNRLFYTARINGLFGDPETAKSWIAMAAIAEALEEGQRAAYLDADHNGANEIATRLISLGAPPHHVANSNHFRVYEPEHGQGLLDFVDHMLEWAPHITVIDSLGEIVPMLGLKSTDNDDLTRAIRRIIKPLAHTAASCVITIDHLPKSQEARVSGYAIGGIAKKRAVDGSYLLCEAITPPAPGRLGKIKLGVEKDRHGHVRGAAAGRTAGIFHLDSTSHDTITWKIEVPVANANGDAILHTGVMEAISRYLEMQPGHSAPSKNTLVKAISGQGTFGPNAVSVGIEDLVEIGAVRVQGDGRRKAHPVVLIQPYREIGGLDVAI